MGGYGGGGGTSGGGGNGGADGIKLITAGSDSGEVVTGCTGLFVWEVKSSGVDIIDFCFNFSEDNEVDVEQLFVNDEDDCLQLSFL